MASTSSLLKSASSRQAKILSFQDQEAAFQWESSAQTYDDYQQYANYLITRSNATTDPSQGLSFATKLRAANSSYTSNEIQRQTQSVMEGSSTNTAKQQKLVDFYYQALDSGNNNLAQNLRSQIDSLSITIQGEQQSAQVLARGMAADQVTTLQDYIAEQQDNISKWNNIYKDFGAEGLNDSLHQFSEQLGLKTDISYFDVIAGIIGLPDASGNYPADSMIGALATGAAGLDAINANKLKADINKIVTGTTKFDLPGIDGVTYSDIVDALDAQRAGQNIYAIGQDSNGNNIFIKNKLDNYTWGQDANGQMRLIKTYDPRGDFSENQLKDSTVLKRDPQGNYLDSKDNVTKDVSKAARVSYQTLLGNAGFQVAGVNADGSLRVIQGTSAGGPLDVTGGGEFNVIVDDEGNLRFLHSDASGQKNLYSLSFDANGGANLKQLTAENTSVFGDTGYYKSHANDTGQALVKQIIGQPDTPFDTNLPSTISSVQGVNGYAPSDVNPYARPLNTSDILKQGDMTSRLQASQTALIAQNAAANPQFPGPGNIQASSTFDLNRTAVPANSGLKVSNAPPTPKIAVSAPAPTSAITKTNVAPTTNQITSVGVVGAKNYGKGSDYGLANF